MYEAKHLVLDGSRFPSLRLPGIARPEKPQSKSARSSSSRTTASPSNGGDFSALPDDILIKIAATFKGPNLVVPSLVCRAWRDALRPLREAMMFFRWGKRFKHGRRGVRPNLEKALDSFLKGAACGYTLAMVDAGLLCWELGRREEAIELFRKAAELGDPAGQCNLAISYLQDMQLNLHSPRTR